MVSVNVFFSLFVPVGQIGREYSLFVVFFSFELSMYDAENAVIQSPVF